MRSIIIITLIVVISFFHFNTVLGQTPQPVRITNFGTYTGDQVKALRGEIAKEFDVTRVVIADGNNQVGSKLTTVSDQLEQTNRLLQQQHDRRWRWWEILLIGMALILLSSLILSILAENYLLPLRRGDGNNPVTPPASLQEEEGKVVGDYANDRSIIINGDVNAPVTIVFGDMTRTYYPPSQNRNSIDEVIKKTRQEVTDVISGKKSPATGER